MKLPELQVLHLDAAAFPLTAADRAAARAGGEAWVIDTCQRTVIVSAGRGAHERIVARLPLVSRAQGYSGTEAYAFLLRFACGLESRLVGECEIFGQIKESWREFASAPNPLSRKLDGWVQRLFKDTKEVRAGPLSRLGSASYGSQVRRLLGAVSEGPTLLVGAGQLAQAVAPWIETAGTAAVESHGGPGARAGATGPGAPPAARLPRARGDGSRRARSLVARRRRDPVRAGGRGARCGAHLLPGRREPRTAAASFTWGSASRTTRSWAQVSGLTSLAALFDMLRTQSDQRGLQVARARRACAEKAVLRSLGPNATEAHGWEDLAAFATISP